MLRFVAGHVQSEVVGRKVEHGRGWYPFTLKEGVVSTLRVEAR